MATILPKYFRSSEIKFINNCKLMHNMTHKISNTSKIQIGGLKTELIHHVDVGGIYSFLLEIVYETNGVTKLIILNKDKVECVLVLIENKEAVIHNISYYEGCAIEGLINPGGGNILLRFILNYLVQHKKKYNIHRIILTDISQKYCKLCKNNINLSQLMMITIGRTWYMKYGFKPYASKSIDKYILNNIKNNRIKLKTLQTKNIPILKLTKKAINNNKLNINLESIKKKIDNYNLLKDFIINLNNNFDKYCCILSYVLEYIYKNNILHDPHHKDFYLDLQ